MKIKLENLFLKEIDENGKERNILHLGQGIKHALKMAGDTEYSGVTLLLNVETDNGLVVIATDLSGGIERAENCADCSAVEICPEKEAENERQNRGKNLH